MPTFEALSLIDAPIVFGEIGSRIYDNPDPTFTVAKDVPSAASKVSTESKVNEEAPLLGKKIDTVSKRLGRKLIGATRKTAKYVGSIFVDEEEFCEIMKRPVRYATLDGAIIYFKAPSNVVRAFTSTIIPGSKTNILKKIVVYSVVVGAFPATVFPSMMLIPAGVVSFPIIVGICRVFPTEEDLQDKGF
jgi:hypothetical protein